MLDPQELQYLQTLQASPVWMGILKKMAVLNPPPTFKPGQGDKNYLRWVYESGVLDATTNMLSVMSGRQITHEDISNE